MIGARIHDGDIVYIRLQPDVENGEIAAVLIDDEATLKRVYKKRDSLVLQPENPAYEPLIFVREEMNSIRILGKAVCFFSKVK
jgi:repressor LexA